MIQLFIYLFETEKLKSPEKYNKNSTKSIESFENQITSENEEYLLSIQVLVHYLIIY